jgi:hypothetical protein
MAEEIRRERHKVTGEKLMQTVMRLVHEGNVRRIIIKDDDEHTIVELPLTVGVVGALLLPAAVAVGAIAALAADLTLEIERVGEPQSPPDAKPVESVPVAVGAPDGE